MLHGAGITTVEEKKKKFSLQYGSTLSKMKEKIVKIPTLKILTIPQYLSGLDIL